MIKLKAKGDFRKADSFFEKLLEVGHLGQLDKYGRAGVEALRASTPVDSGKTADSWGYEIIRDEGKTKIVWTNDNINDGVNIAVILQYGHGLENGGWVEGVDYINPSMQPVFDDIAEEAWKEVSNA